MRTFGHRVLLCAWLVAAGCVEDAGDAASRDATLADRGVLADAGDAAAPDATEHIEPADAAPDGGAPADAAPDGPPPPACSDGLDNDGDGRIDHPADPGCSSPDDPDETDERQCADGLDNDGDGRVDLEDPDCTSAIDPREDGADPVTACSNGVDDDGDGLTDFPLDPGCGAAGDDDETDPIVPRACSNRVDDDGDGLIDYPRDPGCAGAGDPDESDPPVAPACADGVDNDGDGAIDWPADQGCTSAGDFSEESTCGPGRPIIDLNAHLAAEGGYAGDLSTGAPGFIGSCGGDAGPELVFAYRLERPARALRFTTEHPETTQPTVLYVRRNCAAAVDLVCNRGAARVPGTSVEIRDPAPGLFYVVVDTGSRMAGPGPFRLTAEVVDAPACRDELDNDEDGLVDLADPGCVGPNDEDETDPEVPPQCADGIDNDRDGFIDYPEDPQCTAAGINREGPLCVMPFPHVAELGQAGGTVPARFTAAAGDGPGGLTDGTCRANTGPEFVVAVELDELSEITVRLQAVGGALPPMAVYLRQACDERQSEVGCRADAAGPVVFGDLAPGTWFVFVDHAEAGVPPVDVVVDVAVRPLVVECNDEVDNDADGLVDLFDPGCADDRDDSEQDPPEPPQCADGIDNDGDGLIDYPEDDGCMAAGDEDEAFACEQVLDPIQVGQAGGVVQVDTTQEQDRYVGSCGGQGNEAVIELRLDVPSNVVVEVTQGDYDTLIFMRSACEDAGTEIGCNDDGGQGTLSRLAFPRLEPGRYYVFIDGFFGATGQATVQFTVQPVRLGACEDGEDNDGDGLVDLFDPGCVTRQGQSEQDPPEPPQCADGEDNDGDGLVDYPEDPGCVSAGDNDEGVGCIARPDAPVLGQAGGVVQIDTRNRPDSYRASCGGNAASPDQAIILRLDVASRVTATVTAANYDTVLHLRSVCEDARTEIACNDDFDGARSRVQVNRLEAGTYFVIVDGFSAGSAGTSTVAVVVEPLEPLPGATACADRFDNDEDGLVDAADPGCLDADDDDETDPPGGRPECGDGVDNDGDGLVDRDDPACDYAGQSPESQGCAAIDAIDITNAGGANIPDVTALADALAPAACQAEGAGEVVFRYVVSRQRAGGTLQAVIGGTRTSVEGAVISIRQFCDEPATELACGESEARAPGVAAGEYFVIVEATGAPLLRSLGRRIRYDVPGPGGEPYVPAQAFTEPHESGWDAWTTGGEAPDLLGGLVLGAGEASAGVSIAPGTREVAVGDTSVRVTAEFEAPGILRVDLAAVAGDAPLTLDAFVALGGEEEATLETGEVAVGALAVPYAAVSAEPDRPRALVLVAPRHPDDLAGLTWTPTEGGLAVHAEALRLPASVYLASTYGAAPEAAAALAGDLVHGQIDLTVSVEQ